MNEADSLRMAELLGRHAFAPVATPDEADLILVNTCAIREKAEQKLLSALGRYREVKARRGALIARGGLRGPAGEGAAALSASPTSTSSSAPTTSPGCPRWWPGPGTSERFAETGWMSSEEYVFPLRRRPRRRAGGPPPSSRR